MNLLHQIFIEPFAFMGEAPDLLLQVLWEGFVSGILYALIALGFVLIFKASGVFNFAQGIMVVFAALTLVGFYAMGVPAILSLALAIGVMFLLAVTVERVVLRPLVNQPDIILFMATFGITYFLIGFGELIFGGEPKQMITSELLLPEGRTSFDVAGGFVTVQQYRYRGCGDRGDHDRHPRRVLFQDPDRTWIAGRGRQPQGRALGRYLAQPDLGDRVVCRRHRGPGDRDHVGCALGRLLRLADHRLQGAAGADPGRASPRSREPSSAG